MPTQRLAFGSFVFDPGRRGMRLERGSLVESAFGVRALALFPGAPLMAAAGAVSRFPFFVRP